MNATISIVMAGAPLAGSFINRWFGWRAPLLVIAVLSALTLLMMILCLPETKKDRTPWRLMDVVRDYRSILLNREFSYLTFGPSVLVGVYLTFVGTAPFFYQTQLGLSIVSFAIHQGCVLASFSIVSVFTGKINNWLGMKQSIRYGNILAVFAALCLLLLGFWEVFYPYSLTIFMCLHVMGIALSFGTTVAIAFNAIPNASGAASSVIQASRLFISAAMIACASELYDGTWISIASLLFVGALFGCFLIERGLSFSKTIASSSQTLSLGH